MGHLRTLCGLSAMVVLFGTELAGVCFAGWVEDGVAVCDQYHTQQQAIVVSDGEGGAFIVWEDNRNGGVYYDIYVQRVNGRGEDLWAPDGVAISDTSWHQTDPHAASDGEGGLLVVWRDTRGGVAYQVYAQRIDASGSTYWTHQGIPVCAGTWNCYSPRIASDGQGGAVIAWGDIRSAQYDVYAQRIDKYGVNQWTADGEPICTQANDQYDPKIGPDGTGGAVIVWEDYRTGSSVDVYAQRIDGYGSIIWTTDGEPVAAGGTQQIDPQLIADGQGGLITAWKDNRVAAYDIYAQRMDPWGGEMWTTNGVAVCTAASNQETPQIASDGEAGAIITWLDYRDGVPNLYAQRMGPWGTIEWTVDGEVVTAAVWYEVDSQIISDGQGGAIIAWADTRFGNYYDVYAQKMDASGNTEWTTDGVAVSTALYGQVTPHLDTDGSGGAIIAWTDTRNTDLDIYAQRVERNGHWGYPAPVISTAHDIPGDQGGWVTVAWDASRLDSWEEQLIYRYTVWRAIDQSYMMMLMSDGAAVLSEASELEREPETPIILAANGGYYWEYVLSCYAYELESYSEAVPTLFDSTSVSSDLHYFQVIAHMSNQDVYWVSEPASGYSVDNLSPEAPLGLAGEYEGPPPELLISWNPNAEMDLSHYAVYKGMSEGFIPDETNRIGEPADTFLVDPGFDPEDPPYYKVSAWDLHENESDFALLRPEDVVSGLVPTTPKVTRLEQNIPNPFADGTWLRFSLAEPGRVVLRVYDVSGRPVRTLVDNIEEPDRYEVRWNCRDDRGAIAAPGVYFYKLETPGYTCTMKMVLLK